MQRTALRVAADAKTLGHTEARLSASEIIKHKIEHEESNSGRTFYVQYNGRRVAEMTYSRTNLSLIIIDHTNVDANLSGQGRGERLT